MQMTRCHLASMQYLIRRKVLDSHNTGARGSGRAPNGSVAVHVLWGVLEHPVPPVAIFDAKHGDALETVPTWAWMCDVHPSHTNWYAHVCMYDINEGNNTHDMTRQARVRKSREQRGAPMENTSGSRFLSSLRNQRWRLMRSCMKPIRSSPWLTAPTCMLTHVDRATHCSSTRSSSRSAPGVYSQQVAPAAGSSGQSAPPAHTAARGRACGRSSRGGDPPWPGAVQG